VLVGLLLVSLLDASLLSLPFFLAACVGALVPVRYVIYGILAFRSLSLLLTLPHIQPGTIPMQLYSMLYLTAQYVYNIEIDQNWVCDLTHFEIYIYIYLLKCIVALA